MPSAKRVLVTGCARGIGQAIAEAFASAGWEVVGVDLLPAKSQEAFSRYYQMDVSDPAQVQALALSVGPLTCLVNNAAIQVEKTLLHTTPEEWTRVIGVNLNAAFYLTKACSELLKNGSIINISSVHSRATSPGLCAYATSKGALSAFTRAAALELAHLGIRVNSILPGAIDTEMLQQGLQRGGNSRSARDRLVAGTPLKRIGQPADVAKLTLFLADTDLSGNITGQEFACDGGVLARLASE